MKKLAIMMVMGLSTIVNGESILQWADITTDGKKKDLDKMVDGDLSTKWRSYHSENAENTLTLSFEEQVEFNAVSLLGSNFKRVGIEISEDGASWEPLESLNIIQKGRAGIVYDSAVATRFIRLHLKGYAKHASTDVSELNIYSVEDTDNKALMKKVTSVSDGENWRFPVTMTTDGQPKTHLQVYSTWKSSQITIDLNRKEDIKQVVLYESGRLAKIDLFTSKDGKSWQKQAESLETATAHTFDIPRTKARYVRVDISGKYGHHLNEIEVY